MRPEAIGALMALSSALFGFAAKGTNPWFVVWVFLGAIVVVAQTAGWCGCRRRSRRRPRRARCVARRFWIGSPGIGVAVAPAKVEEVVIEEREHVLGKVSGVDGD